jgi:catechol 2,3-dioxygenase-like lactoylglutathione lyase family enzyme
MRPLSTLWKKPTIAHVSIGVRDIDRSKRFYDTVLEPLGYKCLRAARTLLGYGYGRDSIALWIVQAEHPVPADEKSGLHFCFTAENAAAVEDLTFRQRRSNRVSIIQDIRPYNSGHCSGAFYGSSRISKH